MFSNSEKTIIGAIDCTEYPSTCKMFDIQGFPTLKLFKNTTESSVVYHGERKLIKLAVFLGSQVDIPISFDADSFRPRQNETSPVMIILLAFAFGTFAGVFAPRFLKKVKTL